MREKKEDQNITGNQGEIL